MAQKCKTIPARQETGPTRASASDTPPAQATPNRQTTHSTNMRARLDDETTCEDSHDVVPKPTGLSSSTTGFIDLSSTEERPAATRRASTALPSIERIPTVAEMQAEELAASDACPCCRAVDCMTKWERRQDNRYHDDQYSRVCMRCGIRQTKIARRPRR